MKYVRKFIEKLENSKNLTDFLDEVKYQVPRCYFNGRCYCTGDLLCDLRYYDIDYTIVGYEKAKFSITVKLDGNCDVYFKF